mmetsp:Transcript_17017/g.25159  ORF Transcript_17017/g.25159 Transcript_17017/m.25159 type:complete len:225 (-) Transcript_17017:866-1540(-)
MRGRHFFNLFQVHELLLFFLPRQFHHSDPFLHFLDLRLKRRNLSQLSSQNPPLFDFSSFRPFQNTPQLIVNFLHFRYDFGLSVEPLVEILDQTDHRRARPRPAALLQVLAAGKFELLQRHVQHCLVISLENLNEFFLLGNDPRQLHFILVHANRFFFTFVGQWRVICFAILVQQLFHHASNFLDRFFSLEYLRIDPLMGFLASCKKRPFTFKRHAVQKCAGRFV